MDTALLTALLGALAGLVSGVGATWLKLRGQKISSETKLEEQRVASRAKLEEQKLSSGERLEELYLNAITTQVQGYQVEIERLKARLGELESEVATWKKKHDSADETHWALKESNKVLAEDLLNEKRVNESLKDRNAHLVSEVERVLKASDAQADEIKSLTERLARLEANHQKN